MAEPDLGNRTSAAIESWRRLLSGLSRGLYRPAGFYIAMLGFEAVWITLVTIGATTTPPWWQILAWLVLAFGLLVLEVRSLYHEQTKRDESWAHTVDTFAKLTTSVEDEADRLALKRRVIALTRRISDFENRLQLQRDFFDGEQARTMFGANYSLELHNSQQELEDTIMLEFRTDHLSDEIRAIVEALSARGITDNWLNTRIRSMHEPYTIVDIGKHIMELSWAL